MSSFDKDFEHLTGHAPFPWQQALFKRFLWDSDDHIPSACDLPTGLGKTSVVAVWLLALAKRPERMPRRLVYVVNRRTVVDQTTAEVERYRKKLSTDELEVLRNSLADLCAGVSPDVPRNGSDAEPPLAISTLRGQFADNRAWSADPARPAVVVGTVDMIGSRLLFSGYGCGFKTRPLHAGFLGQDALLVHDEAHLEPAFQELLERIETEQHERERTGRLPWKKLRVMQLSATKRSTDDDERKSEPFTLTNDEAHPPEILPDSPTEPIHHVWRRLKAKKGLKFVPAPRDGVAKRIGQLARAHRDSGKAVLVFVRTLDDVQTVRNELTKKDKDAPAAERDGIPGDWIELLTGTLRGKERDELVEKPVFARFLSKTKQPEGTVYLVCTSAGEVGIDISADHMVCDLTTLDSMIQRLGRVNRRGDGAARIDVVAESDPDPKKKDDPFEAARWKTRELLERLPPYEGTTEDCHDASSLALRNLLQSDDEVRQRQLEEEREAAFAPLPTILPATDMLFDAWALTSVRGRLPGRPPVEPYLHGVEDEKSYQTKVAWREEVWLLDPRRKRDTNPLLPDPGDRREFEEFAESLLDDFPLKPHELLGDSTFRKTTGVRERLKALAAGREWLSAWIQEADGTVLVRTLGEAAEMPLANRTVILPPEAGGLGIVDENRSTGFFDGSGYREDCRAIYDVADLDDPGLPHRRIRVWSDDPDFDEKTEGLRPIRRIEVSTSDDDDVPCRVWCWFESPKSADGEGSKSSLEPIRWDHHTRDVKENVERIVAKLPLSDEMRQALVLAAKWHDLGKRREVWQRSIGNPNPTDWHAKSGRSWKPIETTDYRHEFGSLLDVLAHRDSRERRAPPLPHHEQFASLPSDMQELVLHLIAAHHGAARPHFEADRIFDPARSDATAAAAAAEVPRRFARLQRRYGRWGLAWLESLLRAADYAASANPSPLPAPTVEARR